MEQASLDTSPRKSSAFHWALTLWILLLCVTLLMVNVSWAVSPLHLASGQPVASAELRLLP